MSRPEREGIMLAYPGDEGRIRRLGDRVFAQPKLKGERCRVEWFKGEPVLLSSYGNEFNCLPHINESLKMFAEDQIPFDGELYQHGRPFDGKEGIHSICSRRTNPHPLSEEIQFHIFDIQWTESSQWFRFQSLFSLQARFPSELVMVNTEVIDNQYWLDLMKEYVDDGYEGIILRNPISLYRTKRDVGLIKVKPTETDEYKIIGIAEAISLEGIPKGMVGSFLVQDKEGITFEVGAGKLNHKKREDIWKKQNCIGKTLVVKHEPTFTQGGIPECAVAVRIE